MKKERLLQIFLTILINTNALKMTRVIYKLYQRMFTCRQLITKCEMTQRSNKLGIGLFEELREVSEEASTGNNNDKLECSER